MVWVSLTAINLNKAFHIDDTFHLEAAGHLLAHPARPMSGLINWKDVPTPMYTHNQPPLFFFLIALGIRIFGEAEAPLHLLFSLWTLLALFLFQQLTRRFSASGADTVFLLFACSPATVVNQNLMTDMPLLACLLGSFLFLIRATATRLWFDYSAAACCLGLGLLIKYSMLPLLVVLALVMLVHRDAKKLAVLAIPAGLLLLWSWWNFWEYGSCHLTDRPKSFVHINKLWGFLACLGSMATFLPALIDGIMPRKWFRTWVYFFLLLFVVSAILCYNGVIPEDNHAFWLNGSFWACGILAAVASATVLAGYGKAGWARFIVTPSFIAFLYLSALSLFIILFAPFNATRHILLILPFLLLFVQEYIGRASAGMQRTAVIVTVALGLLLGVSDWVYADYYRKMAALALPEGKTVWTAGHWGWQWYARQNGMQVYATGRSPVKAGDYFVYPARVSRQTFGEELKLIAVDSLWEEAGPATFFSGSYFASMYNSFAKKPAWRLSRSPLDTIFISRVGAQE